MFCGIFWKNSHNFYIIVRKMRFLLYKCANCCVLLAFFRKIEVCAVEICVYIGFLKLLYWTRFASNLFQKKTTYNSFWLNIFSVADINMYIMRFCVYVWLISNHPCVKFFYIQGVFVSDCIKWDFVQTDKQTILNLAGHKPLLVCWQYVQVRKLPRRQNNPCFLRCGLWLCVRCQEIRW